MPSEEYQCVRRLNARPAETARPEDIDQGTMRRNRRAFQSRSARARKDENKQFIVRLSGPERAQPGAPNIWRVETYKRNGVQIMPNKVEWAVKDQAGRFFSPMRRKPPIKDGFREPPTVALPVSFWEKVKPDSDCPSK